MLTERPLALTVSLLLSAQATPQEKKQPPTAPPQKLDACNADIQAIALERGA